MAHQMKNLCVFSVFHCVEGAFGAASRGTPKTQNGAPRNELKNGRGRGWAVPYMKQNASAGEQSEAPRRRWKPGLEQHSGPENQESQHMLIQPRGLSLMICVH